MILSNKLAIHTKGLNFYIIALLDLANEVIEDGGTDKDELYSLSVYQKFNGEVLVSSMSQVKSGTVYAYEL